MPNANDAFNQLISSIEPNLKFGGVLLALALASFKVGNFFWNHEREIAKETIERLKDILGHFKDLFIRPILEKKTQEWIEGAYKEAVNEVSEYVISHSVSSANQQLTTVEIQGLFTSFAKATLVSNLQSNDRTAEFYSSRDGVSLLEKLDKQYLRARDYKRIYDLKISACRYLTYFCFALAVIFLLGLFHLISPFSEILIHFLVYNVLIIITLTIIQFARYEFYRRKLSTIWEDLKTMGNFDA